MTNSAAIGYMILAAKRRGLHPAIIRDLESSMFALMDERTEEEAEEAYRNN